MLGFLYAFGAAFFTAASDAFAKKALCEAPPLVVAWVRFGYATPALLLLLLCLEGPWPDTTFWMILLALLPLEIIAMLLYMRSLKISPLSLTVPFLAMTPVFTLVTSLVMLGEFPDLLGLIGVLLIGLGAYLLNVHLSRKGVFEPFKAVGRERGSLMMIVVAFIYSITSNLGKIAIQHASPLFMAVVYFPFLAVGFLPVWFRVGMRVSDLRGGGRWFLLIGLSQALVALCHFQAISMMLVPYMISVKRMSLLLGVLYGALFFGEEHVQERLVGSGFMLAGVMFIVM